MAITAEAERWLALERAGYSVMNLDGTEPVLDLYTDVCPRSFVADIVEVGCRVSQEGAPEPAIQEVAETLYGPARYLSTTTGRAAEQAMLAALQVRGGIVLSHGIFFTTRKAFGDVDTTIEKMPVAARGQSDVDIEWLARRLQSGGVTAVSLEPSCNALTGWLLSVENCEAVAALCKRHGVLFTLDATRILTNFLDDSGVDRDAIKRVTSLADAYTIPVSKELLVPYGGLVAVRDAASYGRAFLHTFGRGTTYEPLSMRSMLVAGMQRTIEKQDFLVERRRRLERMRAELSALGVPQVEPGLGHAIFVPIDPVLVQGGGVEKFRALEALLFAVTGMRNLVWPNAALGCPLIRLASPLARYTDKQMEAVAGGMRAFLDRLDEAPTLTPRPGSKNSHPFYAEYDISRV